MPPLSARFPEHTEAALLDPEGDGHYVLERMWKYAEVDFTE